MELGEVAGKGTEVTYAGIKAREIETEGREGGRGAGGKKAFVPEISGRFTLLKLHSGCVIIIYT